MKKVHLIYTYIRYVYTKTVQNVLLSNKCRFIFPTYFLAPLDTFFSWDINKNTFIDIKSQTLLLESFSHFFQKVTNYQNYYSFEEVNVCQNNFIYFYTSNHLISLSIHVQANRVQYKKAIFSFDAKNLSKRG